MTEMIRHDIQRVRWMMESCLSKRPCTSRTTQFYVAGDADPQYNITITYLQPASRSSNILYSFRLSADVLDLNATTCVEHRRIITALRTHGPMHLSDVLLQADVIVDTRNRLRFDKNQIGFSNRLSGRVNLDNNNYQLLVQHLTTFIAENC
uniref:Cadherin domain-containing protein n=1 Tax=Mesocestoides corti TaxID=53468 RepID=A0A5K3FP16_MESCO